MMVTLAVPPDRIDSEVVKVDGHAYRHLFRARRLGLGSSVRLVDGRGRARWAEVVEIDSKAARLRPGLEAPSNEPDRTLELIAPMPKSSRLSWMVEKVTEIGATAVHLIGTERAPRQTGSHTRDRLGRVARAAMEQCHRSVIPEITGVHAFSAVQDLLGRTSESYFLRPGSETSAPSASNEAVSLLVGPEGGWTEEEEAALGEWGSRPWGLGPTVLRIETAAAVGAAGLLIDGLRR